MITVGREIVTELWVGDKPIGQVMHVGVEVWPNKPLKSWFKTFTDVIWEIASGSWILGDPNGAPNTAGTPDLTDKTAPVKGCMVVSVYILAGNVTVSLAIHDGTQWTMSSQSLAGNYSQDISPYTTYGVNKWWNTPDGDTDYNNFAMSGDAPTNSYVCMYAAPNGIKIAITDREGMNAVVYVEKYPPGVSQADMPPSADLV